MSTAVVNTAPPADPAFLDVNAVAALLSCSAKHVTRQAKDGRMPAPVKFGRLCRWPRPTLEAWLAAGCPRVPPPSAVSSEVSAAN